MKNVKLKQYTNIMKDKMNRAKPTNIIVTAFVSAHRVFRFLWRTFDFTQYASRDLHER